MVALYSCSNYVIHIFKRWSWSWLRQSCRRKFKGSLMGISIGTSTKAGTAVTATEKMWRSLQALGAIAFAYSFSIILIEIQVLHLYTSGKKIRSFILLIHP
ncbi:hypothetical protein ACB092_07G179600 [Castanea dentata]